MNILCELLVAVALLGLTLVPLFGLTSSNVARCSFTLERKEAHHLAWALVERYRQEGLGELLRKAAPVDGRWAVEDPHLRDRLLQRVVASRLEAGGGTVSTRVEYENSPGGLRGLGCLRSTVSFTRQGRTLRVHAARFFIREA